ncbi:MAG: 5-formyltetrahydrofolate cyclo-ligase [Candidatus Omnitrophota bacterium]
MEIDKKRRTMIAEAIKKGCNMGDRDSQTDLFRQEKEKIRKQMIRRLGEQPLDERKRRSKNIEQQLFFSEEFKDASTILAYVSLPQEVDTGEFIQEALKQGKRVGVPYILSGSNKMTPSEIKKNDRLERGPLGIEQPGDLQVKAIPMEEIDLVIVPALAYDRNNMRLGRGKGFYDTFLSDDAAQGLKTIGVAFSFQVVDLLPRAPHDRYVDRVITEQERS